MTYLDLARLGRAAAALLAEGHTAAALSDPRQAQAALVCRDTVVAELRSLTRAVLRVGPGAPRTDLTLLTTSPAHALHAALDTLPPATGRDVPLTAALTLPAGPLLVRWQDAARAAVGLERHHDSAAELAGTDAWQVLRDVADLAAALPHLDTDLAAALPPGHPRESTRLLDPAGHSLTRLAADQLRAQSASLPAAAPAPLAAAAGQPSTVRTLADLPAATGRLAALVQARGAELTAAEAAAVSRMLGDGLALTARVLHATGRLGGPEQDAAAQLQHALPALQQLAAGQVATLTPPAPALLDLAARIRERLRGVAGLVDRLEREPAAQADLARPDLARVAPLLLAWALQTPPLAAAVHAGLEQAARGNRLVAPRTDSSRGPGEHLLWMPLRRSDTDGPHATLAAAADGSRHLADAEALLYAATGPQGAARPGDIAVRSPARTDRPNESLRTALSRRAPTAPPARAAHPAMAASVATSRQHRN